MHQHKTFFDIYIYDDIPATWREAVQQLKAACFGPHRQTPHERVEHDDRFCSAQDSVKHLLAITDDAVIGNVTLLRREIPFKGRTIHLGGIGAVCTHKPFRRMGVASALLTVGMEELHSLGCDVAYLCADVHNPGILTLYRQRGFVPLGRPHTYRGRSGKRYTDRDGLIAPVTSPEPFAQVIKDQQPFDIGRGNW
jgi:GNAT superfamily N-acetyltransferase